MDIHIKRFSELTLDEFYEILRARISVFVVEQQCPYQELDDKDQIAWHLLLRDNKKLIAYLRIIPLQDAEAVSIGRVLTLDRGEGYGALAMRAALKFIQKQWLKLPVLMHAQVYAKGFYEQFAFQTYGEVFLEDDIPHIAMRLDFV